jgi:GH24 family phage-related lysozyme (muramidase)
MGDTTQYLQSIVDHIDILQRIPNLKLEAWSTAKLMYVSDHLADVGNYLCGNKLDNRSEFKKLLVVNESAIPELIDSNITSVNTRAKMLMALIEAHDGGNPLIESKLKLSSEYMDDIVDDIDMDGIVMNEGLKKSALSALVGLGVLGGASDMNSAGKDAQVSPRITHVDSSNPKSDSEFIGYIKFVENGIRSGYSSKSKKWYPHTSAEGGTDTIAYGHKLHKNSNFKDGLTEREAISLLMKDLTYAERVSISDIKRIAAKASTDDELKSDARTRYDQLGKKEKQICLDFAFNIGTLRKFPKFFTALLNRDVSGMRSEYERSSKGKPLVQRNQQFYKLFLKNYEPGA